MSKELLRHIFTAILFCVFVILVNGWFSLTYWTLVLGAVIGSFLPDLDHLIYVYFLSPRDLSSQRINYMVSKRNLGEAFRILSESRAERKDLIFHTTFFQLVFLLLTFFVITSSGSIFGIGLVLSFSLHLLVDQLVDFRQTGGLANWFASSPLKIPGNMMRQYMGVVFIVLLLFGIFL